MEKDQVFRFYKKTERRQTGQRREKKTIQKLKEKTKTEVKTETAGRINRNRDKGENGRNINK